MFQTYMWVVGGGAPFCVGVVTLVVVCPCEKLKTKKYFGFFFKSYRQRNQNDLFIYLFSNRYIKHMLYNTKIS
jgi:hypothetical protein